MQRHELDPAAMKQRVRAAYLAARDCGCGGDDWYVRKSRWIRYRARKHGRTFETAVAAYALLSANCDESENDRRFEVWAATDVVEHFGEIEERIRLAEDGDLERAFLFKNAAKLATFNATLRRPRSRCGVVIDRHSGETATGDRAAFKAAVYRANLAGYRLLEQVYIDVADEFGVLPQVLQASTWVHKLHQEVMSDVR